MAAHTPFPSWITAALATLSLLGTGYYEYFHNDKDLTSRVSKLEAHQEEGASKIDHIQTQVDRLVEWAMGGRK